MADPIPLRRPVNWANLRADEAERLIHERAAKGTVVMDDNAHANLQAQEREIPGPDVRRILTTGVVLQPPVKGVKSGEWEAVIQLRIRGTRDAGAATIILKDEETIIVKTIMWMDYQS